MKPYAKEDLSLVIKSFKTQKKHFMINKGWKLAIVDRLFHQSNVYENIVVHAKLVHGDDYFEIMVPEFEFKIMYISKKRILKFL